MWSTVAGIRVETTLWPSSGIAITAVPDTNLLYTKTVIPAIRYRIPLGKTVLKTQCVAQLHAAPK